jgi:hypothetical protein
VVTRQRTLVLFPWIAIKQPVRIGRWRLLPYTRKDAQFAPDIHRVMARYRNGLGESVPRATVLEVGGQVGGSISERTVRRAFALAGLMSFAALARRRLFEDEGYVNAQQFACIATPYDRQGVALRLRRRDAPGLMWHPEETYQVVCPPHIDAEASVPMAGPLLATLMRASARMPWLTDAVELFNLANADSPDVQSQTELVLTVAALQRALEAETLFKETQLAALFVESLQAIPPTRSMSHLKRRIGESAPRAATLRELWFRDLYRLRNAFAHGQTRAIRNTIWNSHEHLCLASYVIPRVIMMRLTKASAYEPSVEERDSVGAFDYLLCLRTFRRGTKGTRSWPWSESYAQALREIETERVIAELFAERGEEDGSDAQ